ncbi:hypothetical protein [Halorhodospira halophila]|uniref:hypothetical protein n=1 Tax=Halorhodospira halophila TaxID=1053 RepID=UPI0032095F98
MRLIPWPRKPPDRDSGEGDDPPPPGVSLDREANERLEQWSRAVRRVRISRSLLSLAWTAGPVTGLGLTGGYWVAYGHPPHTQLLIYFTTFTILSGLIGLLAKIVYDSTWGPAQERAQADVSSTIDHLGDLILASRDLHVAGLSGQARRSEAARQLLRRVDLSPAGIGLACQDLTGDRQLGEVLARIESYRRSGLFTRIRDLNAQHEELFDTAYQQIRPEAPLAASALRERFLGEVPQLRAGIARNEAFIERVLAGFEEDNPLLITMGDVEDMLGLAFELINGREIPILTFTYRGRWQLARALETLETARSRYRLAQAASDNRIRALAAWLIEADALPYELVPEELPSNKLLERVMAAMDDLQMRIDRLQALEQRRALDRASRERLARAADTLGTALSLYRSAREALVTLGTAHAELLKATERWNDLAGTLPGDPQRLRTSRSGRGLRIVERTVALDEDARQTVCQQIMRHLRDEGLEWLRSDAQPRRPREQVRDLTPHRARHLAVETALALEPHIQLSRPEVQRGLGATNASYLGGLEPGMSAREKRDLGEAMAASVEEDLSRSAEQLALALVRHYHVELTEDGRRFLTETYGARERVLATISRGQQLSEQASQVSLLSRRPTPVPLPRRDWYRSLVRARRALRR